MELAEIIKPRYCELIKTSVCRKQILYEILKLH